MAPATRQPGATITTTLPDYNLAWHVERAEARSRERFVRLKRLVALAVLLAKQQRQTETTQQRLACALYLPTLDEQIAAVADVLVDLSPAPDAA